MVCLLASAALTLLWVKRHTTLAAHLRVDQCLLVAIKWQVSLMNESPTRVHGHRHQSDPQTRLCITILESSNMERGLEWKQLWHQLHSPCPGQ